MLFGVSWEMVEIENDLGILGGCIPHILLEPQGLGQVRAGCGQGSALPSIGTNTAVSPLPVFP